MYLLYFLFIVLLGSSYSSNNVEDLGTEKIIGGTLTRTSNFHFIAAVKYTSLGAAQDNDINICTASIIGDLFIATVAHCFYDKENQVWRKSLFYIAIGRHNLNRPTEQSRYIQVDTITVPSIYNPNNPDTYSTEGNLAIAKLKCNIGLRSDHPYLTHLTVAEYAIENPNGLFFAAAYGFNEITSVKHYTDDIWEYRHAGRTDGKLRHMKVKLMSNYDCSLTISDIIAPGNMCAVALPKYPNAKTGLCRFDSGAPLSLGSFLKGIAINGFRTCDERYLPGIYIDTNHYRKFFKDVLAGRNTSDMRVLKLVANVTHGFEFREVQLTIST